MSCSSSPGRHVCFSSWRNFKTRLNVIGSLQSALSINQSEKVITISCRWTMTTVYCDHYLSYRIIYLINLFIHKFFIHLFILKIDKKNHTDTYLILISHWYWHWYLSIPPHFMFGLRIKHAPSSLIYWLRRYVKTS